MADGGLLGVTAGIIFAWNMVELRRGKTDEY